PDIAVHVSKFDNSESRTFDEEYQEFLRYKSEKSSNLGQSSSMTNVSTACISESVEGLIVHGFLTQVPQIISLVTSI
ncbi:hypothetical protein VIGAN_09095400, partial [Vigna angularis var. angularis]